MFEALAFVHVALHWGGVALCLAAAAGGLLAAAAPVPWSILCSVLVVAATGMLQAPLNRWSSGMIVQAPLLAAISATDVPVRAWSRISRCSICRPHDVAAAPRAVTFTWASMRMSMSGFVRRLVTTYQGFLAWSNRSSLIVVCTPSATQVPPGGQRSAPPRGAGRQC